jgi:predicted amidophosphoribosyltransferase
MDRCPQTEIQRLTLFTHDSPARHAIHALKFGGDVWRGQLLGELVGPHAALFESLRADLIVPIPLHARRYAQRGYNQSERIARSVARITGIPLGTSVLDRNIHQAAQARASVEQREERENPFYASPGTGNVVLVDDVTTTGTTFRQAAEAMRDAGFHPILLCALVRTERRSALDLGQST